MNKAILKLQKKWNGGKFVCVGLDPDPTKARGSQFEFNRKIIDATSDLVCCYKPNTAFYEAKGLQGWKDLKKTIDYIKEKYPDIHILLDAKRGDVDNTSVLYAKAIFEVLGVDAVTVQPYQGLAALQPFFRYKDKLVFVLTRSSNPGAKEFQDLKVGKNLNLYMKIAKDTVKNYSQNAGLVVGATYPKELLQVRKVAPNLPILIPGVGSQKGLLGETIKAGLDSRGGGIIISSSRSIIFAKNPRAVTLDLHNQILKFIK